MPRNNNGMGAYNDNGRIISTNSMIKTFRRCPKQFQYKYIDRLKPKVMGRPLRAGTWMHNLQEEYHMGRDWMAKHEAQCLDFGELMDEEKDAIGNLPEDAIRMMKSYIWHYKNDEWIWHETEMTLECEFPDGTIYRLRLDGLIENEFGLWIVDHKWHKTLPDLMFRTLDTQSALYIMAAHQNGIPVSGHIWNYAISKPPTKLEMLKSGKGPRRWNAINTDFPTAMAWFKKHPEVDITPYKPKLRVLKKMQYQPGEPQTSPFFRRDVLEKTDQLLNQVWGEAYHTSKRMHSYPFHRNMTERTVDRSCKFMCSYSDLCSSELVGGTNVRIRKQRFEQVDPMYYYHDEGKKDEKEE